MEYNILVVDDSKAVLFFFKKTIEISGIPAKEVFTAGNGVEALKVLELHSIDLVITDINMPEMNGFELIKKMKNENRYVSIPIIVITTEGRGDFVKKIEELKVNGYIMKPFHPEVLKKKIESILGVKFNAKEDQDTDGCDF